MYALNINKETGRILSATYPQYATADAVIVDELPEGDITDYIYVDGVYGYDPLPKSEAAETAEVSEELPSHEERITELEEALELILSGVTV